LKRTPKHTRGESAWQKLVSEQPKEGRAHPDFQYTIQMITTLKIKEKETLNGITRFLDTTKMLDYLEKHKDHIHPQMKYKPKRLKPTAKKKAKTEKKQEPKAGYKDKKVRWWH